VKLRLLGAGGLCGAEKRGFEEEEDGRTSHMCDDSIVKSTKYEKDGGKNTSKDTE
jgi:hypothetical protein